MSEYQQDRPSTESIASMGRDDAATTTADDRPTVVHDDRTGAGDGLDDGQSRTDGLDEGRSRTDALDEQPQAGGFDDGQSHAAPGTYATGDEPTTAMDRAGDRDGADHGVGGTAAANEAPPSMERPDASDVQLMPEEHSSRLRDQWQQVQATFVDDPRGAVSQADTLVAEVMQTLAAGFAEHKRGLEESWQRGEQAGTEDLRMALQSYRAFFDRLLHS